MKFEPMFPMSPATREILRKHDEQNEIRERFYQTMMTSVTQTTSPAPSCCPDRRSVGLSVLGTPDRYAALHASALKAGVSATKQTRVNAQVSTIIIERTQRIVIYREEQ